MGVEAVFWLWFLWDDCRCYRVWLIGLLVGPASDLFKIACGVLLNTCCWRVEV